MRAQKQVGVGGFFPQRFELEGGQLFFLFGLFAPGDVFQVAVPDGAAIDPAPTVHGRYAQPVLRTMDLGAYRQRE